MLANALKLLSTNSGLTAGRAGALPLLYFQSGRHQGTNFGIKNPSANIRNHRLREDWEVEEMNRVKLRPCLPESIVPTYMLPEKPCPPWPYKDKGYKYYHKYLDNTTKRFDENTRLITVEGNFGSNCNKFARELAQVLGFHFIPQPQIEDILIDRYGIDKRDFYHLMPEKFCLFDTEMFFNAPDHPMVNYRQYVMYFLKFEAYANALAHIMNTGQGVVLERSVHTDVAFVRAMHEMKFLSDYYAKWYPRFKEDMIHQLKLLPHIVVYLDTPVSTCMENIKKRARPWEHDSRVVDFNYLAAIEDELKRYCNRAELDSHVLRLDWKEPADIDSVAEEIYKIDLAFHLYEGRKFHEWNFLDWEIEFNELRHLYTSKLDYLVPFYNVVIDVPELVVDRFEAEHVRYISEKIIGKYAVGYNRSRGDKLMDILFPSEPRKLSGGPWIEYTLRDTFWTISYDTIYVDRSPMEPNIPEEEFEPRRFDPSILKHWSVHH